MEDRKLDIKYLGVPNVCFSLTDKDDNRESKFIQQRLERGFDDSETWSLYNTISFFILPRLIRYQEIANTLFQRTEEEVSDIDSLIRAFSLINRNDGEGIFTKEEEKEIQLGLEKFHKVFRGLWW